MPRFTIRRLMLAIGGVAGVLAVFRSLDSPMMTTIGFLVVGTPLALLSTALSAKMQIAPRLATWGFVASAFLTNAFTGWLCIYHFDIYAVILMWQFWIVTSPFVVAFGAAWVSARPSSSELATDGRWALVFALGLMPGLMFTSQWPLHVAFLASQPAMERLADRVAAGETRATSEWAGVYRIAATIRHPESGNVALLIDPNPSGRTGFVRIVDPLDSVGAGPLGGFNDNIPMSNHWRYQTED